MKPFKLSNLLLTFPLLLSLIGAGCEEHPKTVNAETGEVVQESNRLEGTKLYTQRLPLSSSVGVVEYKRGNMVYLIIESSHAGSVEVVNYTLDSIEMSWYHDDPRDVLPPGSPSPPIMSNTKLGVWR